MSFESHLIIIIIHYISLSGLVISGLLALFLAGGRKKLFFMFLSFLFAGILNFVYYSGVLFFIAGIIIIFFFLALYLFVSQVELFNTGQELKKEERKLSRSAAGSVMSVLLPFLLCSAAGYLVYDYTSDFLDKVSGMENISILSLGDIAKRLLSDYSLAVILTISLSFLSFLWFLIMGQEEK